MPETKIGIKRHFNTKFFAQGSSPPTGSLQDRFLDASYIFLPYNSDVHQLYYACQKLKLAQFQYQILSKTKNYH